MATGTAAALFDLERYITTTENPEIDAMAAIAKILSSLPDESARMRVMRWSFGRFSEEFKRPLPERSPAAPLPRPRAAVTPIRAATAPRAPQADAGGDMGRQIAELEDLFDCRNVSAEFDTSIDL